MKLIIMRHGEAETYGPLDSARCLTPNGIKQAQIASTWLRQYLGKDKSIDLAMVSPFVRAEQTYVELLKEISCKQKIVSEDIIPSGNYQLTHDYIDSLITPADTQNYVLLVSHMPFISYFVEEVTINKCAMLFDTSSIVVIDYDLSESAGLLECVYHPN
ncbi:phosphohistidine phosphatase SixA [Paraglaciecola aquimarina]|uniref:Phosphohistidine phosphatase SixA n=1 Tax=Paraglaciecola algarum TaxID=3050085 RepID=A0ABS9DBY8_9ALTE|nr:phosphohistidine phosphatase SixA [Paraglaciecola sp. G1-23]MCF2950350.1 phosphohistidine phosphatase SixA [Paraglaciecola sp. G1-23]